MKMTNLYAIAGWAIIAFGVVHMLATFRIFHAFNNAALWFFSGGIAIALTRSVESAPTCLRSRCSRATKGLHWHEHSNDDICLPVRRRDSR
jgi:hypothetical protein